MEVQDIDMKESGATIAEIVVQDYRTAQVFKKFGLDFCCGGKKSISKACEEKSIDKDALIDALQAIGKQDEKNEEKVESWNLDVLVDHIITKHHNYVTEAIPALDEFSAKVARVHGDANPEVIEIASLYQMIAEELRMHMHKEEVILFPYIKQLAAAKENQDTIAAPGFGTIENPIKMMEAEHDSAGDIMGKIHQLSSNFTPPDHACNTYRVLFSMLKEFEEDLHRHIHLENNILFPKAIALEQELLT